MNIIGVIKTRRIKRKNLLSLKKYKARNDRDPRAKSKNNMIERTLLCHTVAEKKKGNIIIVKIK
jgi:hypothetical protein